MYVVQEEALGTAHAVSLGYAACKPGDATIVVQADVWAEPAFFEALIDNPVPDALSIYRHECKKGREFHNKTCGRSLPGKAETVRIICPGHHTYLCIMARNKTL